MGENTMRLKELLVIEEEISLRGTITLYHFTKEDEGEKFVLDPKKSKKNRSYYSANDYNLSTFPRVFYYTDLNKIEKWISSPHLYSGKVNGAEILNLTKSVELYTEDSQKFKSDSKQSWEVADALLRDGKNWDAMFKKAAKYFKGIYYDKGNLPIVNLFVPLEVTKNAKR